MSDETPLPDWLTPGSAVVRWYRNSGLPCLTPDTVDRLTKTQVILASGRRFRRSDLGEIGGNYYASERLIRPEDDWVAEAQRAQRIQDLENAASGAVDRWRWDRRNPDLAKAAAEALLATIPIEGERP